jgi:hypothetical protein
MCQRDEGVQRAVAGDGRGGEEDAHWASNIPRRGLPCSLGVAQALRSRSQAVRCGRWHRGMDSPAPSTSLEIGADPG